MIKKNTWKVIIPIAALLLCGLVVLLEREGVTSKYTEAQKVGDVSELTFTDPVEEEKECLILTGDENSETYCEIMKLVLDGMSVAYDVKNVTEISLEQELPAYKNVVLTFMNWDLMGDQLYALSSWLQQGGHLMNTATPNPGSAFKVMAQKMGVLDGGTDYTSISGITIQTQEMIGNEDGQGLTYDYTNGGEEEALEVSLNVRLRDDVECYVTDDTGEVPILWSGSCGEGTYAFMNQVVADKFLRGFLCFSYSLLDDVCIYPVINGSAFYLDDFPAPVPEGNSEYVKRDYGVDTATFYNSIWWPAVLEWAETYGIRHTGLIIEEYSDQVKAPFERNEATSQFLTFGNMLLNNGGELGFHGYNHMPLCLEGIDDDQRLGTYKLWPTVADMESALTELSEFSSGLFPGETFSVYVPPSNIMSETGKEALLTACPSIKVIASSLLKDSQGNVMEQEFGVEENGVIDTPRITSGCMLDDFQQLTAFSELNFQYVQSHFMHPDDVLDVDRGAELGWEELSGRLEKYIHWIYTSAPNIRNVTGSEMGSAVLQYTNLSMTREYVDGVLKVSLGGFSGEAYFLMRINEELDTAQCKGCTVTPVTGNLYEVHATQAQFEIGAVN